MLSVRLGQTKLAVEKLYLCFSTNKMECTQKSLMNIEILSDSSSYFKCDWDNIKSKIEQNSTERIGLYVMNGTRTYFRSFVCCFCFVRCLVV